MMNKEMFLKELQDRLAVLEESERQDILAEYAQHIELRTAGGLTEEAAIQDFGDLDQLTAEILGAYHGIPPTATRRSGSTCRRSVRRSGPGYPAPVGRCGAPAGRWPAGSGGPGQGSGGWDSAPQPWQSGAGNGSGGC